MSQVPDETGIIVKSRVHPLALLLRLCKTNVTIDGNSFRESWGEHFFGTIPGTHEVRVSFNYLSEQIGNASITVEVHPRQVIRLCYQSPAVFSLMLTSKEGVITIED
jgi:hypothetical protein